MARPRIHPEGTTATDRGRARDARLVEAGGKRVALALPADVVAALDFLRVKLDEPTTTAVVSRLVREALNRSGAPVKRRPRRIEA